MTHITPVPTADLADEWGDKLRYLGIQFNNYGGHKAFAGAVTTVSCRGDNALVKQVLNTPSAGGVLVVDGGGNLESALCGDMIAAAAVNHGWVGLVICGAIRDSVAIGKLPLGVKALGRMPRKSAKEGTGQVDCVLQIGGVEIRPGDILHADEDGVVILPPESQPATA